MKYDPILTIKANEKHYFSALFGKELYMFQTVLRILRSILSIYEFKG